MARRRLVAVAATGLVAFLSAPSIAGADRAESIGPDRPATTWQGRRFDVATVRGPEACAPSGAHADRCDHVTLNVGIEPSFWAGRRGGLTLSIGWSSPRDDFDLYLYDAAGELVAIAAASGTTGEQLFVADPSGVYEARVVPTSVVDAQYRAVAAFQAEISEPAPVTSSFTYGPDQANWYWRDQRERKTNGPGGRSLAVRLASPQSSETFPVAIRGGKQYKSAALGFDLGSRGLAPGGRITSFTLTVDEQSRRAATRAHEDPPAHASGESIEACRIVERWGPGEAELWSLRPAVDRSSCAVGVRADSAWAFDLTALAQRWAADPSATLGVLLTGKVDRPGPATWQVNLKIPARDDPATPRNEYAATADRVQVELLVLGGAEPPAIAPGGLPSAGPAGTSGPPPGSGEPAGGPAAVGASGGAASGPGSGSQSAAGPAAPPAGAATRQPVATVPSLPWYVWVLMPFVLLAVVTSRAAIHGRSASAGMAGAGASRAVASIRRQNRAPRPE